jgi:CheY-like chemotaxis protein
VKAVTRARVLVVDDNAPVAEAIVRLLGTGFDAVVARDGEAARAQLETREEFEVVLCDVRMPRMSGLELFRWVEREHPSLRGRFVFMTAEPDLPEARPVALARAWPIVRKPCTRDELLAAVHAVRGAP